MGVGGGPLEEAHGPDEHVDAFFGVDPTTIPTSGARSSEVRRRRIVADTGPGPNRSRSTDKGTMRTCSEPRGPMISATAWLMATALVDNAAAALSTVRPSPGRTRS